jgi:hypothetical protein
MGCVRGAARRITLALVLALVSGCAVPEPGGTTPGVRAGSTRSGPPSWAAPRAGAPVSTGGAPGSDRFVIGFDDTQAPSVFQAELIARRDRPKGTQGLWATVSGLRRAERAVVVNLATGATAEVALFNGPVKRGETRISNAAAVLLGIGAEPVRVRVTALRSEPVLVAP